jgi:hypothetical protein
MLHKAMSCISVSSVLVLNSRQFFTFTLLSLQQTGFRRVVELDVCCCACGAAQLLLQPSLTPAMLERIHCQSTPVGK